MSKFDELPEPDEPVQPVSVEVTSTDPGAEVVMLDSRLQTAARGIGGLKASLNPGVYKLVTQTGTDERAELVLLRGPSFSKTLSPLKFASPMPIDETSRSHEYHMDAARKQSETVHVTKGKGSKLFLFARDWTPESVASDPSHHPAEGLKLYALDGTELVNFETQSVRSDSKNPQTDPCAACNVELDPGAYRVGVTLPSGQAFEQIVITAPDWRTDVFVLQRVGTGSRSGKSPDLAGAAISLSRLPFFDPGDPSRRLTETARLALKNRHPIAEGELGDILKTKFQDPVLGILGGQLILLAAGDTPLSNDRRNLLETVVGNLRNLLGSSNQDVEALALAAGMSSDGNFDIPPMLRRNWQIILDATAHRKAVTTASSLTGRIATQITNQDPWLIWERVDEMVEVPLQAADYLHATTWLFSPEARARFQQNRTRRVFDAVTELCHKGMSLFQKLFPNLSGVPDAALDVTLKALLSDDMMPRLVRSLGIPRANVEEMISAAYTRLKEGQIKSPAQPNP